MPEGTKEDPWMLATAPGTSQYTMYRDGDELVCQVGSTKLTYQARAVEDLHAWLKERAGWVSLGASDEKNLRPTGLSRRGGARKPTLWAAGTVCERGTEAGSVCTCRHYSNNSGSPNSPTMRGTTACELCSSMVAE